MRWSSAITTFSFLARDSPPSGLAYARGRRRRAPEDPRPARDRRQPAEAGRLAEKIRQSYERALALATRARAGGDDPAARRDQARPISNGSQEDLLHPRRLRPEVVRRRGRARRGVRRGAATPPSRAPARARRRRAGRRARRPRAGRTRAGRRRASRRRCARRPSPRAAPVRTARSAPGRRRRRPRSASPGTLVVGDAPDHATRSRPSSLARSGPSPTNVNEPRPRRANASASRTTFLRSVSEPTCTKAGCSSAAAGATAVNRSRSTPESITTVFPRASADAPRASPRRSSSPPTAVTSATSARCRASAALTRRVVRGRATVIAVSDYLRRELELKLPEARGKTVVDRLGRRSRALRVGRAGGDAGAAGVPVRRQSHRAQERRPARRRVRGARPRQPDVRRRRAAARRLEGRERVRVVGRVPHDEVPR